MSISRVKTTGWSSGDALTSSQTNAFDTTLTRALDKTSAGDTLSGPIQLFGAGRIIQSVTTLAPTANTTVTVGSSNTVVLLTTGGTSDWTITLSATGAVTGDTITFLCDTALSNVYYIKDAGANTLFEIGNHEKGDGSWATFLYIGGWRLYQNGQGSRTRKVDFTSSTTWKCPRGVNRVMLYGYGGGGAGGVGGRVGVGPGAVGGGGGGGAMAFWVTCDVTPDTVYTVTIGTGGVSNGSYNGGDTSFASSSATLAAFPGATGGANGFTQTASGLVAAGGVPGQLNPYSATTVSSSKYTLTFYLHPHIGGNGGAPVDSFNATAIAAGRGGASITAGPSAYVGGAGGTTADTYGGGGGGGAGPGGNGGAGASANAGAATAGTSASDNTGAGGGGACGINLVNTIPLGGSGGSGRLALYYTK